MNPGSIFIHLLLLSSIIPALAGSQSCDIAPVVKQLNAISSFQISGATGSTNGTAYIVGQVWRNDPSKRNGLVGKLSKTGTVIWSREIFFPLYNYVAFDKVVINNAGRIIIAATIIDTFGIPSPFPRAKGLLITLDSLGNFISSERFDSGEPRRYNSFSGALIRAGDGKIIATNFSSINAEPNTSNFFSITSKLPDGKLNWTNSVRPESEFTFTFFQSSAALQCSNGDVVVVCSYDDIDEVNGALLDYGLCFIRLNAADGKIKWYTPFKLTNQGKVGPNVILSHAQLFEQQNGEIVMAAGFDSVFQQGTLISSFPSLITLTGDGNLKTAKAWVLPGRQLHVVKSEAASPTEIGMIAADGKKIYWLLNDKGTTITGFRYDLPNISDDVIANTMAQSDKGWTLFGTLQNLSAANVYVNTYTDGSNDCAATPITLQQFDISRFLQPSTFKLRTVYAAYFTGYGGTAKNYQLKDELLCTSTCCNDVANDNSQVLPVCDGIGVQIPNGPFASTPGFYLGKEQLPNGCDSFINYEVQFLNVPEIAIPKVYCLTSTDSVLIRADSGYSGYTWNGVPGNADYWATNIGSINLVITNACGTATSKLSILDECDLPVYIPTAFTPNSDGNNDIFRYPATNVHRLVVLRIFDRWGNMVFTTTDETIGWDGTYKKSIIPTGVYAVQAELESPDGRRLLHKSTLALIR